MNHYKEIITHLKNRGFSFWSFKKYISRSKNIPSNLIVIRHDIHLRDIEFAYKVIEIEKEIIGEDASTYFVMYDFPAYYLAQKKRECNPNSIKKYSDFINFCLDKNVDVQPHIDPISSYIVKNEKWKKFDKEKMGELFKNNYLHVNHKEFCEIKIINEDILSLNDFNNHLVEYIKKYTRNWENIFKSSVQGFAPHISSKIGITNILPNGILMDQKVIRDSCTFEYQTCESRIREDLMLLSDNSRPLWMLDFSKIKNGRYQFENHPYLWSNDMILNMKNNIRDEHLMAGYIGYPYLAAQEVIFNINKFLDSKKSLDEYNKETNGTVI